MSSNGRPLEVRRSERFRRELESLLQKGYDPQLMGKILLAVETFIATTPEERPIVPGTDGVRLVKTSRAKRGNSEIPMLGIWYRVENDGSVQLLALSDSIESYM